MAMLAETKRRQKLSTDPRNKAWSNDGCKFGEQLMKKMGWQQGKGLGLHEDGKTSHISVAVKNNVLGLGHSQKHDDNWINHQDDFNDLLSSLNQDHNVNDRKTPACDKPQKLQEKCKKAKRRVHYNKFTQGKDLSTYSSSQMNCIMGVRSTCSTPNDQSRDQSETNSDDGGNSNSFGMQTTSSNSIEEYFAQKMKQLRQKRNREATSNMNSVSSSTAEAEGSKAMNTTTDSASVLHNSKESSGNICYQTEKKRRKKLKRKDKKLKLGLMERVSCQDLSKDGGGSQSSGTAEEEQPAVQHDMADTKKNKKKKRKAKSHKDNEEDAGYNEGIGKSIVDSTTDGKKRKISQRTKSRKSLKTKAI